MRAGDVPHARAPLRRSRRARRQRARRGAATRRPDDRAYNAKAVLATGRDEVDEALQLIDRALQEALRSKDADSICRAYVNYSDTLRQCGRFEDAVTMAERGVAFTSSTGMRLTTGAFIHTNGA